MDEHVCRLQVAVEKARRVGFLDPGDHSRRDLVDLRQGEATMVQQQVKRLTHDILHDQRMDTIHLHEVGHRNQIGMAKSGLRTRLSEEALRHGRVEMMENFYRVKAAEMHVASQVYRTHSPRPQESLDDVPVYLGSGENFHPSSLPRVWSGEDIVAVFFPMARRLPSCLQVLVAFSTAGASTATTSRKPSIPRFPVDFASKGGLCRHL